MMIQQTMYLRGLQDQLKKEYLLLEREQRQKVKIKKDIGENIQSYYSVVVDKRGIGRIEVQDGLGNCYNFVKDIVLDLSKDELLGVTTLSLAPSQSVQNLTEMLVSFFYDSYTESDPYFKKIIKFGVILAKRICSQLEQDHNKLKPKFQTEEESEEEFASISSIRYNEQLILRQYLKQEHIKEYFQMLANKIFSRIPSSLRQANLFSRWGSFVNLDSVEDSFDESNPMSSASLEKSKSLLINHEQQIDSRIEKLVKQFMEDILNQAELLPLSIRVLVYTFRKQLRFLSPRIALKLIWEIIFPQYLRPLEQNSDKRWSQFKNNFFKETVGRIGEELERKSQLSFYQKVLERASVMNDKKISNFQQQKHGKRITINGGCISYRQIYLVLKIIKENNPEIKKINERAANRCLKVNQITKQYQLFLTFKEPETSYLVFTQLTYGQIVERDYQSLYVNSYKDERLKNMLKQILSDPGFHISHSFHNQSFKNHLEKIIKEQQMSESVALNYSAHFVMKIKYFLHLLTINQIDEQKLFSEMIKECKERQNFNIQLFKQNKIQLLQTLTSVNKACKMAIVKKENERKVEMHLKVVKILDSLQLSLYFSAPSTRPKKNEYTSSSQGNISIHKAQQALQGGYLEQGLKYHASTLKQALFIFTQLKEVKQALLTGKDKSGVYEVLTTLIERLKQECRRSYFVNTEENQYFETSVYKVILRELHEILLQRREGDIAQDAELSKKLSCLAFIRPNLIKIQGLQNFSELEQVWQIVCRYLKHLGEKKSPIQKIEAMRECVQILKIALQKQFKKISEDRKTMQILLAYCLIRSKPPKFIITLNFIQIFLSKDKLMSRQGGVLRTLRNSVNLILNSEMKDFLTIDSQEYEEKKGKGECLSQSQKFKDEQKNSISYI